jgi:hypothetical protein
MGVLCSMALWKLTLIGLALLSVPWLVLKLVLYVCNQERKQLDQKASEEGLKKP